MALPATDAFTGTNGTALPTYSASWTNIHGSGIEIQGNAAETAAGGGAVCICRWNADTFNNDQYAFVVLDSAANTHGQIGPSVRVSADTGAGRDYYAYEISAAGREFYKYVNGTYTGLGANITSNTAANGDIARLEASGTTITPKYNGATDTGMGAVTDSSLAAGNGGISGWDDGGASVRAANWEAGNLGGGGGATNLPIVLAGYGGGFAGQTRGWAG